MKSNNTRLAQLVERPTFNRVVEGSIPSSGAPFNVGNAILVLVQLLCPFDSWLDGGVLGYGSNGKEPQKDLLPTSSRPVI